MITISNAGQDIVSTDYWSTEHARRRGAVGVGADGQDADAGA